MHRPFVCHPSGVGLGCGKRGVLDDMRELKHEREGETEEPMHDHKRHEHVQHGMEEGGEDQHIAKVQYLSPKKYARFHTRLSGQWVMPNMAGKELVKITIHDPGERQQAVERPGIEMLPAMPRL